jgi:steroid delta-isomerase-like uncharacterized protein
MREITRRWIEDGWRKGDVSVVDQLHSPKFVDHDSAGRPQDNEGFKQGIAKLYSAFPDFNAQVADMVVDSESGTVAVRWFATGTHQGEYFGAQPSGRSIRFKGIEIIRLRDDRITERWGEWDGIDLLEQLGCVEL